jgi:hypothetical protein
MVREKRGGEKQLKIKNSPLKIKSGMTVEIARSE